jgi:hypothetical protein
MSSLLDKVKKQLEKQVEEEVARRAKPLLDAVEKLIKVEEEQLEVLKEILKVVKSEKAGG